jgi:hypothetical protein
MKLIQQIYTEWETLVIETGGFFYLSGNTDGTDSIDLLAFLTLFTVTGIIFVIIRDLTPE